MKQTIKLSESQLRDIVKETLKEAIAEKAKSVAQQHFFGMVDAYKKGDLPDASPAVKKAAKGMTKKQVKDFAKTKHKGLPNHVDESISEITYSTQGGMSDNYDIKNFKLFVRQNPELPILPWGAPVSQENQEKNAEVLNQYKDISYKVYNALSEEATRESYHWLANAYTYLKRGDIQKANYSYTQSIRILVDALSNNGLYETMNNGSPYNNTKSDMLNAEKTSQDQPIQFNENINESRLNRIIAESIKRNLKK